MLEIAGWLATVTILTILLSAAVRVICGVILITFRRPLLSIALVGCLPVAVWWGSRLMDWHASIPFWASVLTLVLVRHPTPPDTLGVSQSDLDTMLDELYAEFGVPNGRRYQRASKITFTAMTLLSYAAFYGQYCSQGGACQPLLPGLNA